MRFVVDPLWVSSLCVCRTFQHLSKFHLSSDTELQFAILVLFFGVYVRLETTHDLYAHGYFHARIFVCVSEVRSFTPLQRPIQLNENIDASCAMA